MYPGQGAGFGHRALPPNSRFGPLLKPASSTSRSSASVAGRRPTDRCVGFAVLIGDLQVVALAAVAGLGAHGGRCCPRSAEAPAFRRRRRMPQVAQGRSTSVLHSRSAGIAQIAGDGAAETRDAGHWRLPQQGQTPGVSSFSSCVASVAQCASKRPAARRQSAATRRHRGRHRPVRRAAGRRRKGARRMSSAPGERR